jgi:hypothetical protein
MQGLTNLETLCLESLPDMRCLWKGLVLSKLTTLEVVECKRLTHVFTCSMIVSLVQLKVLKILSCEELEQIIARDNDDEKDQILPGDHLQSLCFPDLCEIEIRECNNLYATRWVLLYDCRHYRNYVIELYFSWNCRFISQLFIMLVLIHLNYVVLTFLLFLT